jgi:hypothetical protein
MFGILCANFLLLMIILLWDEIKTKKLKEGKKLIPKDDFEMVIGDEIFKIELKNFCEEILLVVLARRIFEVLNDFEGT